MTSKEKQSANQRNAQESTGPRTPAGKARSSMNALRTGLYAATVVLPGEDGAAFDRMQARLEADYSLAEAYARDLIAQLASVKWKLQRIERIEAAALMEMENQAATELVTLYDRITRIQGRLRRDLLKLYKELEPFRIPHPAGRLAPVQSLHNVVQTIDKPAADANREEPLPAQVERLRCG